MKTLATLCIAIAVLISAGCSPTETTDQPDTPTLPPPTPRTDGTLKTFHVRPDGGDAGQCNGEADQPYPGQGSALDCAWDHPFRALPPGGPARLQGGDTLIIHAGSYPMGLDAVEGLDPDICNADYAWDCVMPPIPSGLDAAHPTRILGEGWDSGCAQPPELWGTSRANHILDLSGGQYVSLACLEITDHAACAEDHPDRALRCQKDSAPYGDWAPTGLYAQDAAQITLTDITIHGMAVHGVWAGRLTDWEVQNLTLTGNGWAGWDGDIEGDDHNAGLLHFSHWDVTWNGCVESFPPGEMLGCWAQPAGGYGDGVGTGETGGRWLIEESTFKYNTQDGLDLLYGDDQVQIEIYRTWFEGNAGNQLKTSGPLTLVNSVLIGNCSFFEEKPFTASIGASASAVDHCRATGVALSMVISHGQTAALTNNTFTGEGDCLIVPECAEGSSCRQEGIITLRNNLFQGQPDVIQRGEQVCLLYAVGFAADPFDTDYSAISQVKDGACPGAHDLCREDLGLHERTLSRFDPRLLSGSIAIDAGLAEACPAEDYWGTPRPQGGGCDIGAAEWTP